MCGATPLNVEKWAITQRLTAEFSKREFGVAIACSRPKCDYSLWNTECIRRKCPYFPQKDA